MRTHLVILLAAAVVLAPAVANAQTPAPPDLTSMSGGLISLYRSIRLNLIEAAELMPEAHYGFAPADDVRTFGQLVGHVANTQYNFCTPARDVPNPNKMNLETLQTKAERVAALTSALAFCDAAYDGLADAAMAVSTKFGQTPITKGYTLTFQCGA